MQCNCDKCEGRDESRHNFIVECDYCGDEIDLENGDKYYYTSAFGLYFCCMNCLDSSGYDDEE